MVHAPQVRDAQQVVLEDGPRAAVSWREIRARLWPESGAVSPIPALDGLRGVAVLLVIVFHAWYDVPGVQAAIASNEYAAPMNYGRTGVQLFFVLSGFLLFLPYARWLFGLQSRPSAMLFYRRRALRVVPAYWVSLVVVAATIPFTTGLLNSFLAHIVFLHNVFYNSQYEINSVFWTMAVEVQFYAVLPAIGWAMWALAGRTGPIRAALAVLVGLSLVSLACGVLTRHGSIYRFPILANGFIDNYSLPYWLSVFSAGIACSLAYTYVKRVAHLNSDQTNRLRKVAIALFTCGLLLGLGTTFVPIMHRLPLKEQLFGYVFGAILGGALLGPAVLLAPFESRLLRFVGLISYSLYLWHLVVLLALEPHLAVFTSVPSRTIIGLGLDILIGVPVAYVSFQLTERPFFQARKQAHDPSYQAVQRR